MLELVDVGSDKVIGIRLNGKFTAEDFDKVVFMTEERFNRHDKVNFYVEVPSFDGVSMDAFFKDLMFGVRNWRHFKKEAVVTDKHWLRRATDMAGRFTPGIDVKAFPVAETERAREWIKT